MKALKSILIVCVLGMALPQIGLSQNNPERPTINSLEAIHDITEDFLLEAAEMMDEDMFAYRPAVNVRTVAQIYGHIINAQFNICSRAAGETSPAEGNYEEMATSKAQIMDALTESFKYCRQVYANMSEEKGKEMQTFFGGDRQQEMSNASILSFNSTHNYEHYGQLTIYMRINGMVPPSSNN